LEIFSFYSTFLGDFFVPPDATIYLGEDGKIVVQDCASFSGTIKLVLSDLQLGTTNLTIAEYECLTSEFSNVEV
jgi:hypothetical protein